MARVNISLPDDILRELDEAAREWHTTRSAFLATAAKHYLKVKNEERRMEKRRQAAASIRRIAGEIGLRDGTAEILKCRDRH